MVFHQNAQIVHTIYHNTKVVNQIFTVKEVVGCEQEIPGQTAEPWQPVYAIDLIANRNDLFEAFDLDEEGLKMTIGGINCK